MTLHYTVAGDGRSIVLLHGDSASALDWQWTMPWLARHARVYALDLPGYGDSDKPDMAYSPEQFTDAIVAFLDAVGLDSPVLVGHSLGGLVAVHTALRLDGRIAALCLVASGGLGRYVHPAISVQTLPGIGEVSAAVAPTPPARHQRALARALMLYARWWSVPPEWLDEQRRLIALPGFARASLRTRRSAIDAWGQKDLVLPHLHRLRMPALVLWGSHDIVVPVTHAYAAMTELPNARLEIFTGCGHMPHVESAYEFAHTVQGFLDEARIGSPV